MKAIDLFAGAGGFTTGALAAGVDVVWAANHWQLAVETHARNHPGTDHSCQDLMQADWGAVPDHDLLLASPACQGHSSASQPGRRARHEKDRNTAWAVIGCADARRPDTIIVENVRPFMRWELYDCWLACLRKLGYVVTEHVFDTADFGIPQNRQRVIVTARKGEALRLTSPELPHVGFHDCVDWQAGRWATLASKTPGVRARVKAARDRGCGHSFLTHYVTGHRGRELHRPIGTITTKDQWALVHGRKIRMLTLPEYARGMAFPEGYELPATKVEGLRMLGNAIPPAFAQEIVRQAVAA